MSKLQKQENGKKLWNYGSFIIKCIIIIFIFVQVDYFVLFLWLKRIYAQQIGTVFIKQIVLKVNFNTKICNFNIV